jgi:hypothetical protein
MSLAHLPGKLKRSSKQTRRKSLCREKQLWQSHFLPALHYRWQHLPKVEPVAVALEQAAAPVQAALQAAAPVLAPAVPVLPAAAEPAAHPDHPVAAVARPRRAKAAT